MPGNTCQYYNCGKSSSKFKNLKMFRFPKDKERLEVWKMNSGRVPPYHFKLLTQNIKYVDVKCFTVLVYPYQIINNTIFTFNKLFL